jgi:tetratricopeptide (TPR) repeat protein
MQNNKLSQLEKKYLILFSVVVYILHSPIFSNAQGNSGNTEKTIGTILYMYPGSKHQSAYTKIGYMVNGNYYYTKIYYYPINAYCTGQKLMVQYDVDNPSTCTPILSEPYFAPGELRDTTEGMILYDVEDGYCYIYYKTYDPSDSLDVNIITKERYLSENILNSFNLRKGYLYKVIYNKNKIFSVNAEILFSKIIDSTHADLNYHLYMALYHSTNKRPIEALKEYDYCIKTEPNNPFYFFQRAKCYDAIHENEKAIEDYSTYIKLSPDKINGYMRRSVIYIRLHQYDEATKDIDFALLKDDFNDEANYLMGVVYYNKGDYAKAIYYYNRAIYHSHKINKAIYYYDLALAEEKLKGNTKKAMSDFSEAEKEEIANNMKRLYGHKAHENYLHRIKRGLYVCINSENTLNQYSSINSDMLAQLSFPYYLGSASYPMQYDQTVQMNSSKYRYGLNFGVFGIEVGGYKRMYVRSDLGFSASNGYGTPYSFKTCLGYNIKVSPNDFVIFRPELAFTYLNRQLQFQNISFEDSSTVSIYGHSIDQYKGNNVSVSLCENVFNLSPSIGFWLLPYQSRFVLRLNAGYNYTLSQHYSVLLGSIREHLNNVDIKFYNTNGQTTNFFQYSGLFANVSIGIRIR